MGCALRDLLAGVLQRAQRSQDDHAAGQFRSQGFLADPPGWVDPAGHTVFDGALECRRQTTAAVRRSATGAGGTAVAINAAFARRTGCRADSAAEALIITRVRSRLFKPKRKGFVVP